MKINNLYTTVLGLAMAALTLTGCSDEWDDHYDSKPTGVFAGTSLWQAIQQDPNLSNFATVVRECGYDKSLASSQVFTVFAPTNDCFSSSEAEKLIQAYNAEKGRVDDDENTTIKEFLQNHIALYNHSVSGSRIDSIVMMNGKYAVLSSTNINTSRLLTSNQHYNNGILFTVGDQVEFFPNLFEYLRKDADLDSLRSFYYNPRFYRSEFQASRSVPGGIVDGKTVYLDSVFRLHNDIFNFTRAMINSEDSAYLMVAPTNRAWTQLLDEYSNYFNYDDTTPDRDSLTYTNPRLAIVKGTIFSRTFNEDRALADSACSTDCYRDYSIRQAAWGADTLHYYEYYNPLTPPNGVLTGTTNVVCSNGTMMKADDWKINKLETFMQTRIIEAEYSSSIRELSKVKNSSTGNDEETVAPRLRYVETDNPFYHSVSNHAFVEFEPLRTTVNHSVTFNITNVLSNVGYDIYLVTAPALANDSNATEVQRRPTVLRCTLGYHNQDGSEKEDEIVSSVTTTPDVVDAILLAENYKFPVCSYGLVEEMPQVKLKVETRVTSSQLRNNTHTRTMRIDCIILKPHVE